jgi:hypothetical protein
MEEGRNEKKIKNGRFQDAERHVFWNSRKYEQ